MSKWKKESDLQEIKRRRNEGLSIEEILSARTHAGREAPITRIPQPRTPTSTSIRTGRAYSRSFQFLTITQLPTSMPTNLSLFI